MSMTLSSSSTSMWTVPSLRNCSKVYTHSYQSRCFIQDNRCHILIELQIQFLLSCSLLLMLGVDSLSSAETVFKFKALKKPAQLSVINSLEKVNVSVSPCVSPSAVSVYRLTVSTQWCLSSCIHAPPALVQSESTWSCSGIWRHFSAVRTLVFTQTVSGSPEAPVMKLECGSTERTCKHINCFMKFYI